MDWFKFLRKMVLGVILGTSSGTLMLGLLGYALAGRLGFANGAILGGALGFLTGFLVVAAVSWVDQADAAANDGEDTFTEGNKKVH